MKLGKVSLQNSLNAVRRFPLTILLFTILAIISIYRIEMPYEKIRDINEILNRISAVIALGISFTLCVALLFETFWRDANIVVKIGSYIGEIIILVLYYIYLLPNTDMVASIRLLLITVAMILAFLFIPYLPRKDSYEIYITKIITRFITSCFFTVVLSLGLMATLFAIKSLLYSRMSENYFIYTWILGWCIFAPNNFLNGLPKRNDAFDTDDYNKVIKVLLLYIILPIISIYTAVLYLYFGKILITRVWPSGIVSYLVVSYAAVGTAAIFLISPITENNSWARKFTNIFTKAIFPLLIMMFISIGIRINEFGFTENRYFIMIIGIWVTFAMVYININMRKRNIILPVSLAIVAFLTVCGPWNAFIVSKASQTHRFYNILKKYDMIKDNKIIRNDKAIEEKDKREISEILDYFDRTHELNELKYLPKYFDYTKMLDIFGFEKTNKYDEIERIYFDYFRDDEIAFDVDRYELFVNFKSNYGSRDENYLLNKKINYKNDQINISIDHKYSLKLVHNDTEILRYDLNEYIKELYKKYGINSSNNSLKIPNVTPHVIENDKVEVMLIMNNINGTITTSGNEIELNNIEADIFIKLK